MFPLATLDLLSPGALHSPNFTVTTARKPSFHLANTPGAVNLQVCPPALGSPRQPQPWRQCSLSQPRSILYVLVQLFKCATKSLPKGVTGKLDQGDGKAAPRLSTLALLPALSTPTLICAHWSGDHNIQRAQPWTRSHLNPPPEFQTLKYLLVPQATVPPYLWSILTTVKCSHRVKQPPRETASYSMHSRLHIILSNTGVFCSAGVGTFQMTVQRNACFERRRAVCFGGNWCGVR